VKENLQFAANIFYARSVFIQKRPTFY